MKSAIKKIFLRIFFFFNICCIVILIGVNLTPYLNPSRWWLFALGGLIFPLLVILTILFMIAWLLIKPRNAIFPVIAILVSVPNLIVTFGSSTSTNFKQTKEKNDLRVITWNVGLMNYGAPDDSTAIKNNATIFRKLNETDADIICLQEFFTSVVPGHPLNFIDSITKKFNYPYHFFSFDVSKFNGSFFTGSIIFSRYPITDTQKIIFPKSFAGSIIRVGVIISNDTIDIITTRLQTVQFQSNEYKQLSEIKKGSDNKFVGSKNILTKLRFGYNQRVEQVELVKDLISKSQRPIIFTGDLNDVPVSYCYAEVRDNLNDAWVKKGFGFGRTFIYLSPSLRIDHIFFNSHFTIRQVKRILADGTSDHNAVVADLNLIKNN